MTTSKSILSHVTKCIHGKTLCKASFIHCWIWKNYHSHYHDDDISLNNCLHGAESLRSQNLVCISHTACMLHASPSHPSWFDHPPNIWWSIQELMKLLIIQSSLTLPLPPSWVQIFSSAPCSHTPSVSVLPLVWEINFHTHTKQQVKFNIFNH